MNIKSKRFPSYEQWLERPIYRAHCKTASVAHTLPVDFTLLRRRPAYRDADCKAVRAAVAAAVREYRKTGRPFPPRVGGVATRVDLRAFCNITAPSDSHEL